MQLSMAAVLTLKKTFTMVPTVFHSPVFIETVRKLGVMAQTRMYYLFGLFDFCARNGNSNQEEK